MHNKAEKENHYKESEVNVHGQRQLSLICGFREPFIVFGMQTLTGIYILLLGNQNVEINVFIV